MNNSIKIIVGIAVLLSFAAIGYVAGPSRNKDNVTAGSSDAIAEAGTRTGTETSVDTPDTTKPEPQKPDTITADSTAYQTPTDSLNSLPPATPSADTLPAVNTMPEIVSATVHDRNSKDYKKIGLTFTVKAKVESEDKLRYELYETGSATAKYTSGNGVFADVYPVDGGKYMLKVVNEKTGDTAEREIAGFNKIDKYTAAKLQSQLNGSVERLFYCHFDTASLKFDCEGIDPGDKPTNLTDLIENRSAYGWKLVVVGTPKYDQWNRITYFKVEATTD